MPEPLSPLPFPLSLSKSSLAPIRHYPLRIFHFLLKYRRMMYNPPPGVACPGMVTISSGLPGTFQVLALRAPCPHFKLKVSRPRKALSLKNTGQLATCLCKALCRGNEEESVPGLLLRCLQSSWRGGGRGWSWRKFVWPELQCSFIGRSKPLINLGRKLF